MKGMVLLIIVSLISACSYRGGYEATRQNHIQQCNAMQEPARQECLKKTTTENYNEYRQERERLIKGEE